jgi:hypothetical protein
VVRLLASRDSRPGEARASRRQVGSLGNRREGALVSRPLARPVTCPLWKAGCDRPGAERGWRQHHLGHLSPKRKNPFHPLPQSADSAPVTNPERSVPQILSPHNTYYMTYSRSTLPQKY